MCIFFFTVIRIQSDGSFNDFRLNIPNLAGNRSRCSGKEIIRSGMLLYKVPFLKIWVLRAFTVVVLKKLFYQLIH